ncbi:MAG: peptidoglycan/xylan/chitin deacetylase (PgdA/CDA1 family) [Bacteroidia bacterium]|jgi:peptidoglycan/xylan/chitin deacetylase (PgdA/CDA1 family)
MHENLVYDNFSNLPQELNQVMSGTKSGLIRNILIAVVVLIALLVTFLAWCYSGAIGGVDTDEKVIALTYDDGPNPPHTQAMLEVLARHNIKATFFLKGRNVDAFPELVSLIAAAGHEIGNHSYYHVPMTSFSRAKMKAEAQRVNAQLEEILGVAPQLFRPPYGAQGPGLKLALDELQMTSILANAMGLDWEITDGQVIAEKVLADVGPGSIILLHDGHGEPDEPNDQEGRAGTVAATELIITQLQEEGYRFATVSELLALAQ